MADDGRILVLLAAAGLAAAGAVRRRARLSSPDSLLSTPARTKGSRGVVRARVRDDRKLQKAATDLMEELDERSRVHRGFGSRGKKRDEMSYAFDIKVHHWPPDWVETILKPQTVAYYLGEDATDAINRFVEDDLKESADPSGGMDWLSSKWDTEGRQGGWLVLHDEDRTWKELEELLDRWPGDEEPEEHPSGAVTLTDKDYQYEFVKTVARAERILGDLERIGDLIRERKEEWGKHIASDAYWQQALDLDDAAVAQAKQKAAKPKKRS